MGAPPTREDDVGHSAASQRTCDEEQRGATKIGGAHVKLEIAHDARKE